MFKVNLLNSSYKVPLFLREGFRVSYFIILCRALIFSIFTIYSPTLSMTIGLLKYKIDGVRSGLSYEIYIDNIEP